MHMTQRDTAVLVSETCRGSSSMEVRRSVLMTALSQGVLIAGVSLLAGCAWIQEQTGAGETTTTSAVTGAAIGSGLGVIVGSQTGDPVAGLVIGGLAGGAAGTAIGDVLEGQEEAIRNQDEALARQERVIQAQNQELQELRRGQSDSPMPPSGNRFGGRTEDIPLRPVENYFGDRTATSAAPRARFAERDIGSVAAERSPASEETSYGNRTVSRAQDDYPQYDAASANSAPVERLRKAEESLDREALDNQQVRALSGSTASKECAQAEDEFRTALRAEEAPTQLFHLRRALRLCPDRAEFHNALGEVYLKLDRTDDATYEFGEALRIDPSHQVARDNLREAQGKVAGARPGADLAVRETTRY